VSGKAMYRVTISLNESYVSSNIPAQTFYNSVGRSFVKQNKAIIPTLSLGSTSKVQGWNSGASATETAVAWPKTNGEGEERFIVSYEIPHVPEVDEVQTLYCRSREALPAPGYASDVGTPRTFQINFRGFTTSAVWIHTIVDNNLPRCDTKGLPDSTHCYGRFETLREHLLSMDGVSDVIIAINSTTGRLCPDLINSPNTNADLNPMFATTITFVRASPSTKSMVSVLANNKVKSEIAGGSSGDVPLLRLVATASLGPATTLRCAETLRGSTMSVSEVQEITFSPVGLPYTVPKLEYTGFFFLKYLANSAIVPTNASSSEFANAVMELISAKSGVTVTRFDFTDKSRSWRITFPSSFGRANLIQSDRNRVLSLEADTWSGASSLPGFSNTIASRRIVAGFFPAKGSVQLKVFLKTDTFTSFTVDLDINGDGKDLEQQLRVFGNGQLQFASVKPISLNPALTKKAWMIEFHKSSNVNAIKVSSKENIFVQEPQCALVMSAKAPAAVGPSHL